MFKNHKLSHIQETKGRISNNTRWGRQDKAKMTLHVIRSFLWRRLVPFPLRRPPYFLLSLAWKRPCSGKDRASENSGLGKCRNQWQSGILISGAMLWRKCIILGLCGATRKGYWFWLVRTLPRKASTLASTLSGEYSAQQRSLPL